MSRFAIALVAGWILACLSLHYANAGNPATWDPATGDSHPTRVATLRTLVAEEDNPAETKTATMRNTLRLEKLRKPLTDIRIEATAGENKTPTSEAAQLLGDQASTAVTSSGESIPLPDRYTVSSCHRPLYFEELNLERCGSTYGCATNLVSGIHFLTNAAMLPYRMATQRPDCPVQSHGDCQSCQQYSNDIEPFSRKPRATIVEATAIAGLIFLLL